MRFSACARRVREMCQDLCGLRRKKKAKRGVDISDPFDFKREDISLPGVSEEELHKLREKAAAGRASQTYIMLQGSAPPDAFDDHRDRFAGGGGGGGGSPVPMPASASASRVEGGRGRGLASASASAAVPVPVSASAPVIITVSPPSL